MYLARGEELWQALEGVIADEGFLLYDAEKKGDALLRVTIALRPEQAETGSGEPPRSVSSGDTTSVCRRLMIYFLAEGPRLGLRPDVQIEVSSPGVNRELRLPEHFAGALEERIKLVLVPGTDLPGVIEGVLRSFTDGMLAVEEERSGETLKVHLEAVKKARVDFKF